MIPTRRAAATLAGFLLLGASSLVRANFLAWLGFFGLGMAWWTLRNGLWRRPAWWALMLAGAAL